MGFRFKRHRRSEDHGSEDWLMTYADMITLLLCFFSILLSMSVPKHDQFEKTRQSMLKQFADPGAQNTLAEGKAPKPEKPKDDARFSALPAIVGKFNLNGDVKVTFDNGVALIEMNSGAFFTSGSASLTREGQDLMASLMPVLTRHNLEGYKINIEGHTDNIPISTPQYPSNWELSAGRAAMVVRFFIEHGIDPQKLRASGYADAFPKYPNEDSLGKPLPENQARNRRVVIRLEKIEKPE